MISKSVSDIEVLWGTLLVGLVAGSFVNALVWRAYENKGLKKVVQYSIVKGRSVCTNCKHVLSAKDLVPIFSWLSLRGKCRYCSRSISPVYPLVECLTVVLFVFSFSFWPYNLNGSNLLLFVLWLLILTILIALVVYDIKYLTLPNKMLIPLLGLVLITTTYKGLERGSTHVSLLSSAIGFLVGGGIFYIIFQVSGGKWIGGGDVKLGAILGLLLGSATNALLMIFIASALGSLVSVPLLLTKKLKKSSIIPYGPFLITAAIILTLFSTTIVSWLKGRGIYI